MIQPKNTSKKEGWFSPLAFGLMLLMANVLLNTFADHEPKFENLNFAGLAVTIIAVVLWPIPLFTLRKYGEISSGGSFLATTKLVTKGIFKLLRHPQYLSFMLLNTGLALINQDIATILISASSVALLLAGIKEEEQLLLNQFGNQYEQYKRQVPSINIFTGLLRLMTQSGKKK